MPSEPHDYEPLENLLRGLEEPDGTETPEALEAVLREKGIDSEGFTNAMKARLSVTLEERRLERLQERRQNIADVVTRSLGAWTHESIKRFAPKEDPVAKIIAIASSWIWKAAPEQSECPVTDPFVIARWRSIPVHPKDDIADARTVTGPDGGLHIEYNPHRPKARMRFSIAHELAHTIFDDCQEMVRNRASRKEMSGDEWQLEMLCNLGAAEMLMPLCTFPEINAENLSIDKLLQLRKQYEVGVEALLLRVVKLADVPCAVFAASCRDQAVEADRAAARNRYAFDYVIASRSWKPSVGVGDLLSDHSVVSECTSIGFTAKGVEDTWGDAPVRIECVGAPPYPGGRIPRVLGFLTPTNVVEPEYPKITEVIGDALQPRGKGPMVLAFIVNDKTPSWGAGFPKFVSRRWPEAQNAFLDWAKRRPTAFGLGNALEIPEGDDFWLFAMVCQHGYGPSANSRIRYGALKQCLDGLFALADRKGATVHMPKLGSGFANGSWAIIAQLIDESLCFRGIGVTVYNLPGAKPEQTMDLPGLFPERPHK